MSKFKLDFNLYSSKERLEAVKKIPLDTLNKSELETVSNYILFGKDKDGTSVVDRKEVQIKTKFNSYQKNKTISLDELIETPTFDESIFQKNQTIYKKAKPQIDKEKAQSIPGMKELWEEISRLQKIYDQNTGKEPKSPETPTLSTTQLYYLKHNLIDLKTQQYYLVDSVSPTILPHKNKADYHGDPTDSQISFPVLPRGVMREENDFEFQNPVYDKSSARAHSFYNEEEILKGDKPFIDFRNPTHLYQLIQHYEELKEQARLSPNSLINNLLWTLDFYIEKANLSEQQLLIIRDKKFRIPNKTIREHLIKELGISHRENYISTIWNKSIELIIEAVELNYDEYLCKDYKKAWKKCCRCGNLLLRDSRNFVKKTKSADGLTGRCKQCDKKIRENSRRNTNGKT